MAQKRATRRHAAGTALILLVSALAPASADETPGDIVAAQILTQGYACETPRVADRDGQASKPNEAVWILRCKNATYRVRLVPDMAAQVTQLK